MTTKRAGSPYDLCTFVFADGRSCCMPSIPSLNGYCRSGHPTKDVSPEPAEGLFSYSFILSAQSMPISTKNGHAMRLTPIIPRLLPRVFFAKGAQPSPKSFPWVSYEKTGGYPHMVIPISIPEDCGDERGWPSTGGLA